MRREMIGGFLIGALAGGAVDLFTGWWGTGVVGGAVGGSLIGYWLLPPDLRSKRGVGGSDSGGDGGWWSTWSSSGADDSGSDGGGGGGGGDGGGGGGGD